MFETHKIDTFFNGDKNLFDKDEEVFISRRTKVVRFLKLFLPCLTAMLLGVGVALFNFDTTQPSLSVDKDENFYFEKFRMKNTVFEITDEDNQFSILKANTVEESKPGSKIYELEKPDAKTIDEDKTITLKANKGIYNQNKEELLVKGDVESLYDEQITIKTNSANYNFKTEKGSGKEKITGEGNNQNFSAIGFSFDKKNNILTLNKDVYLKKDNLSLTTPKQATLYLNKNMFIAQDAVVTKDKDSLEGNELKVFFKDTKNFEILKAFSKGNTKIRTNKKTATADRGEYFADKNIANLYDNVRIRDDSGYDARAQKGTYYFDKNNFVLDDDVKIIKGVNTAYTDKAIFYQDKKEFHFLGNIKIINGKNIAYTDKAIYYQNKDEFHFFGNVKINQEDTTATSQKGIYFVKKNIVELIDNVIIEKNGNMVRGDKAISDFNTSKSKLIAKKGGRISGKLIESKLKK